MDDTTTPATTAPATKPLSIQALMPNAIDGTGLPKFQLAAETVHAQYLSRGYVVTLCWALDPTTGSADGAMVLFPERRFEDAGAWEITRRGIMGFFDEHNHPTPLLFEEAMKALPVLGYDISKTEIHRLVDVVRDYTDDLVLMPAPSLSTRLILQGDPIWDVTIHAKGNTNKVLREVTI